MSRTQPRQRNIWKKQQYRRNEKRKRELDYENLPRISQMRRRRSKCTHNDKLH